ncbi:MAG TPA: PEGA domain-containing protein, partial [Bacteroidota bacterium]
MIGSLRSGWGVLSLTMCIGFTGPAQGGPADSTAPALCSLTLRTGTDTAWVFIDSFLAGKTPLTVDTLREGRHALRLVQSDLSSWLTGSINDTILLAPGVQRTLRYAFDRRVMVITDPSGAIVSIGDSIAGTTPLVLVSGSTSLPSSVTVERKGYEKTAILLPAGESGIARAALQKIWQSEPSESSLMIESGSAERTGLRLYIAGGATVAAGVAAAYLKIKADGQNALYQDTGDPAFQRATHRLDTSAAF